MASSNQNAEYYFEALTPHIDFGQTGAGVGDSQKIFDFLVLTYEPTGDWPLWIDVFIDGRFHKTLTFYLNGTFSLDESRLDTALLDGGIPRSQKQELNGLGQRIAFKIYMDPNNEGYVPGSFCRLIDLRVLWRPSGEQQQYGDT